MVFEIAGRHRIETESETEHIQFVERNDERDGQVGNFRERVAKYFAQFRTKYSFRLFAIRSLYETKNSRI